jgi:uncharacterized protein YecT (DUF1311 family)
MITLECKLEPPESDQRDLPVPTEPGFSYLFKNKPAGAVGMVRYSKNTKTHEYFGYEVLAEPVEEAGMYRVMFRALTSSPAELGLADPSAWHMLPAPILPEPQTVGSSDTIALDLFENPATGQKIVDYIHIKRETCDSRIGPSQIPCLAGLVRDAQRSLETKLKEMESARDAATVAAIRDSQKAWEKYREQACANLKDQAKRLQCELTLLRNRRRELGEIY